MFLVRDPLRVLTAYESGLENVVAFLIENVTGSTARGAAVSTSVYEIGLLPLHSKREGIVSGKIGGDITAYIPKWIRTSVDETADACIARASAIARPAAVLFVDIAGFTEITDRFAQQAEIGAEQLSELLNDYFTTLIDVVDAFGGDIVAFTGDGFLAAWNDDDGAGATRVGAQCALALQHEMEVRAKSADVLIRLRISVDVGTVYYCRLGGYDGVWRYAVVGSPFENVGLAYRKASVGEIAPCDAAWRKLGDDCEGKRDDGIFRLSA